MNKKYLSHDLVGEYEKLFGRTESNPKHTIQILYFCTYDANSSTAYVCMFLLNRVTLQAHGLQSVYQCVHSYINNKTQTHTQAISIAEILLTMCRFVTVGFHSKRKSADKEYCFTYAATAHLHFSEF